MTTITSLQNPRVKDAVRLRNRRHRDKQRRIVIDGVRELGRALAAGVRMCEVFVCPTLCAGVETFRLLDVLPDCGAELFEVSEAVFTRLAFGARGEGVLGVAEMPAAALERLTLPENPLVAVLEGVEKPGNLGAVLRSADGAGLAAVIVAGAGTDLFNPNAIRASLGTVFTMPLAEAESGAVLQWLRRQGLSIVAARVDGSVPYTDASVDFRRPTAIVLGSEAAGLSAAWSGEGVAAVRLPMLGVADSLNVSAAAAVLFYEARRQRGESPQTPGG